MNRNKKYFRRLRIFILFFCMSFCLMAKNQIVKADLMLDVWQIDGSCAIFFDGQPLKEIQYNSTVVWRAGADITYSIDTGIYEIHFVPNGQTTLSVTGSKEGYEFVGWREDTTASGEVLETDLCTGDEKTLYAVFQKAVTVTYYNGSSTPQTSAQYIYYNNGNISYPEFTIAQTLLNGWTGRGWTTGEAADAEVIYQELDHTALTADMTLYGAYQKNITASFDGNGAEGGNTDDLTGTAYYNSAGNTTNPSFKMPDNGYTKSGYVWSGWMQGGTGVVRSAGENVILAEDTIFSAVWKSEKTVSWSMSDFPSTGLDQTVTGQSNSVKVFSGSATNVSISGSFRVDGRYTSSPSQTVTIVGRIGGKEFYRKSVVIYHDAGDAPNDWGDYASNTQSFNMNVENVSNGTIIFLFYTSFDGGPINVTYLYDIKGTVTYTN